jgi:hypothetical protein
MLGRLFRSSVAGPSVLSQAITCYFMQHRKEMSKNLHRRDLIYRKMRLLERFAEFVGIVGAARERIEFVVEACKTNDVQRSCGKCREDVDLYCSVRAQR